MGSGAEVRQPPVQELKLIDFRVDGLRVCGLGGLCVQLAEPFRMNCFRSHGMPGPSCFDSFAHS